MALLTANCGCLLHGRLPSKHVSSVIGNCDASRSPSNCKTWRRRCQGQDSPGSAAEPPEEAPSVKGDWREFRASLISSEQAPSGGDVWSTRWCEENLHLLQQQDRKLAQEGLWAHETEVPEVGGLLIARPEGPELVGDARYWQLVIFLLECGPRGARGVILNRPAAAKVGDLLSWGYAASPGEEGETARIQAAFADTQVYLGGFYAPNRIARQPVMIMHGQSSLPDSLEILPGIYIGGEGAASQEIVKGRMAESSFRFFAGQMVWEPGQLAKEIERGVWYTAACSRSLVLKQCLQLPVPLWKEILELMGGQYAKVARKRY